MSLLPHTAVIIQTSNAYNVVIDGSWIVPQPTLPYVVREDVGLSKNNGTQCHCIRTINIQ